MQSDEPAMLIQHKKSKIVPQEDDKNCQSTKYYDPNKGQVKSKCSDKNCQENESIDMWPVKTQMDVWSKKSTSRSSKNKKLKGLAKDKNCQAPISCKKQENVNIMTLNINL